MSSFLPAGLATSVDEDPFADPVVPSTATTIQQQQTYQQPQVLQSQQHAIAANDAYRVFTITLQLGVRDIPKLDVFSDSDPMVAVFDAATGREVGRPGNKTEFEWIRGELDVFEDGKWGARKVDLAFQDRDPLLVVARHRLPVSRVEAPVSSLVTSYDALIRVSFLLSLLVGSGL